MYDPLFPLPQNENVVGRVVGEVLESSYTQSRSWGIDAITSSSNNLKWGKKLFHIAVNLELGWAGPI